MRWLVVGAGSVVGVLLVLAMYQVADGLGVLVVLAVAWLVLLLVLRAGLPAAETPRAQGSSGPSHVERWPTYDAIERRLWLARRSPWLFDRGTRPLLMRITSVLLRDRTGVDLHQNPERARALVGDDTWWIVDPGREPSYADHSTVDQLEYVDRLLDRLEEL
jgi:hypothetical protein